MLLRVVFLAAVFFVALVLLALLVFLAGAFFLVAVLVVFAVREVLARVLALGFGGGVSASGSVATGSGEDVPGASGVLV